MTGPVKAGQVEKTERRKRRTVEEGRLVTNVSSSIGQWITAQADDLGIIPATFVKMLVVEAIKARGHTLKQLEIEYPPMADFPSDKRLRENREISGAQPISLSA